MTNAPHPVVDSEAWVASFKDVPFSSVSSNNWYGIGDDDPLLPDHIKHQKALIRAQRLQAKAAFLSDDSIRYPDLIYPELDKLDFNELERQYQALLNSASAAVDAVQSDELYEQAARKLAEMYRHKEIYRRLGGVANEALSRERASSMTRELFGSPQIDDFAHLLSSLRHTASTLLDTSEVAQELLALTRPLTPETDLPDYELSDEAIHILRADLYHIFPGLEDVINDVPNQEFSPEEAQAYMQKMVSVVTGDTSARVVVVEGKKAAETSVNDRTISVGRERLRGMSPTQLIKTSAHESVGHLARGLNASGQSDPAMRQPQTGNLAFEEGFGTAIEQILTGEKRIAGVQYYLSLGLQLGLDQSNVRRDLRDTFEILWRREVVEDLAAGREPDVTAAREKAYLQCYRTNRGGALDARDISYFEGSKRTYSWLNNIAQLPDDERLNTIRIVLSGQFDATDETQWKKFADGGSKTKEVTL